MSFIQQLQQLVTSPQGQQQQQYLASYPAQYMLDIIYDQSQPLDIRRMSCLILKLKMSNKQHCLQSQVNHQMVLAKLQTLFMINSQNNKDIFKLQNSIQLVMEKIFETYFDDQQKIKMFEQITEHLIKEPLCKQFKHLVLLQMMVRQMNYLSVNSQELIGQLVLYLGEFLSFLQSKITNFQNFVKIKDDVCEILAKVVELMKEIKNIVDDNNEEEQNVVAEFMVNSKQLRSHLFTLLKLQFNPKQQSNINHQQKIATICSKHQNLNKVKSNVLNLWHDVWQYHVQLDMLQLLLSTVLTTPKSQIIDQKESIITTSLILLQRSCCHREYADIFFKLKQNLAMKLLELIAITESEFSLIETDIDYFIEINDDFCKQQELEIMKIRAGSLLSNLTLAIDGYLTFVTQVALLALRQHLLNAEKQLMEIKSWESIILTWPCTQQQLIQTSILVLSSISDQIEKRPDLLKPIHSHLASLIPLFSHQSPFASTPLFILRYMQLYSFFSFPSCLDHFLRLYSTQPMYQKQLSKSFETLMRYYDKKNTNMEKYVKEIANSIMLLGDQLTPLLEQEIMRNNRVIQNFKENVLEKLVVWFLESYEKQEVLKINKLSTLIVRILHDNMKTQLLQSDQTLSPFTSQILNTYLQKVYKNLGSTHPCEQSIIQIAISHIQYLYDMEDFDIKSCQPFYQMAKTVTERNHLSLNDCLLLFNALVCPDVKTNRKGKLSEWKFDNMTLVQSFILLDDVSRWLTIMWDKGHQIHELNENQDQEQFVLREEDVWEMLQLAEICFFQIQATKNQTKRDDLKTISFQILQFCLKIADQCQSKTLRSKVISIVLQIVEMFPQNTQNYGFLSHLKYPNPCDFPADQCRKYLYCLIKIMKHYMAHFQPELRVRIIRVIIDLVYFIENEKTNIKSYDQKLFINGDGVALNALQKKCKTYSSLDFRFQFQPHEEFRTLVQQYPVKEELTFLNQEQGYQGKIRDLVDKIVVNDKTRKRLMVKRNVLI